MNTILKSIALILLASSASARPSDEDHCANAGKEFVTLQNVGDLWQYRPTSFDVPSICGDIKIPMVKDFEAFDSRMEFLQVGGITSDLEIGADGKPYTLLRLDNVSGRFSTSLDLNIRLFPDIKARVIVDMKNWFISLRAAFDDASVPPNLAKVYYTCDSADGRRQISVELKPRNANSVVPLAIAEPIVNNIVRNDLADKICEAFPDTFADANGILTKFLSKLNPAGADGTTPLGRVEAELAERLLARAFERIIPLAINTDPSAFTSSTEETPLATLPECPHGPFTGQAPDAGTVADFLQKRPTSFDVPEVCGTASGITFDAFNLKVQNLLVGDIDFDYVSPTKPGYVISVAAINGKVSGDFDAKPPLLTTIKGSFVLTLTDYTMYISLLTDPASVPLPQAVLYKVCLASDNSNGEHIRIKMEARNLASKIPISIAEKLAQNFIENELDDTICEVIPDDMPALKALLTGAANPLTFTSENTPAGALEDLTRFMYQRVLESAVPQIIDGATHGGSHSISRGQFRRAQLLRGRK